MGPPINRHQIEIREPRLPLDGDRLDAAEAGGGAAGGEGVAVSDEEVGSSEGFGAVP